MATAMEKLSTVITAYLTTLARITTALVSDHDEMDSLKRKIQIQINPSEKTDSSMGITSGHIGFALGRITPVHPASGQSKDTKRRQPRQTKQEGEKIKTINTDHRNS